MFLLDLHDTAELMPRVEREARWTTSWASNGSPSGQRWTPSATTGELSLGGCRGSASVNAAGRL
jgi:hypothetical protein